MFGHGSRYCGTLCCASSLEHAALEMETPRQATQMYCTATHGISQHMAPPMRAEYKYVKRYPVLSRQQRAVLH